MWITTSFLWGFLPDVVLHSDFDDSTNLEGQPSGLAATQVLSQTPAAANLLAGTSSNPLDDLVSIFGGRGGSMPLSAAPMLVPGYTPPKPKSPPQEPRQDDLLGLF